MAGKSFPRFERGLRLELNDMIHAAETAVLETIGQVIDEFIIGYDQTGNMGRNYVVRGFTVSNTSGTLLAINNGVAVCQYRHRGAIKSAVHLSGGDPQKVIDVGGLSNGTYYVYVRFDLSEGEFQNRLALDPLASPAPAERVRNVPTRRSESWSVTFADGSPGDEWTQVATFGMSGGAITGVTDTRNLYFEGAPSGGAYPLVPTTDWGTTDDRNNSRGTYGVQGLRKFVRAVQQQLETLQGDGKKWWQTPTTTMNNKLNRDGTNTITGNILPDLDGTRDLGSYGTRFQDVYTDNLYTADAFVEDDLTVTDDASVGGDLTVTGASTAGSYALSAATNWYRSFLILPQFFHTHVTSAPAYDANLADMDGSSYQTATDYLAYGDFDDGPNNDFIIMVPLDGLPHGATLNDIRVSSLWVDAAVSYTVELIRFRSDQNDPDPFVIDTINGTTTGGGLAYESCSASSIGHTINTQIYAYALRIFSADTAGLRRFAVARVSGTTTAVQY